MDDAHLRDRINALVKRAVVTYDPAELEMVIAELRALLREHIQRMRHMAATLAPPAGPKNGDSGNE